MIVLDTNILIRILTKDDIKKFEQIKALIESGIALEIPDVVLPEVEYVLFTETYKASRKDIIKAFKSLISHKNIEVSKEVRSAVTIYEQTKLDMAGCIIAACSIGNKLASYDKDLLKVKGVISYWKEN